LIWATKRKTPLYPEFEKLFLLFSGLKGLLGTIVIIAETSRPLLYKRGWGIFAVQNLRGCGQRIGAAKTPSRTSGLIQCCRGHGNWAMMTAGNPLRPVPRF
jgi:hypothetical protein